MGAVGTLFGAIVGAIGSHYFTKEDVKSAELIATQAIEIAEDYRKHINRLNAQLESSNENIANSLAAADAQIQVSDWTQLKSDFETSNARLEKVLTAKEWTNRKYSSERFSLVE